MLRFTHLTNGFSKMLESLRAAVSLHVCHYNFVRQAQEPSDYLCYGGR